MPESKRLVDLVQSELDRFLDDRHPVLVGISPDLAPLVGFSRDLLRGGKRFRAQFCYWGWRAAALEGAASPASDDLAAITAAATALELFHAAALVHDDIMDNSDTRRGLPATHRRFEALHEGARLNGASSDFGKSAALLLGDLLLAWSDEVFDSALRSLPPSRQGAPARREFNQMRSEVTVGQYLDILEERAWPLHDETELLGRAHRVIVYKSAKYSIEAPLAIGASLAGGTPEQVQALKSFGLPLGTAYQLRDDLLGVFGDPAVTGKPSGDDLREGKRTVLIALARPRLSDGDRRRLDELLGDPHLTADQVMLLQRWILESGAVDEVERIIEQDVAEALGALRAAPVDAVAAENLERLAQTVTQRSA